jgi:hypothetical protein
VRWLVVASLGVVLLAGCTSDEGGSPEGSTGETTGRVPQPSATESLAASPSIESPSPTGEDVELTDLSGSWSGTWANTTPDQATGTFEIEWDQQGDALVGTITIDGTPCLSGGEITGRVNGPQIEFGVVSGEVEVSYTGVYDGQISMSGTYSTSCGDAEGSWEATRT